MTQPFSARSLALLGGAAALALLLDQPAQAHGLAGGGLAAGLLHPLSGTDHLLLLIAVGTASASISSWLLLWALVGAIGGGVFGALGGTLPAQECLAALAITAVAVLVLQSLRSQQSPRLGAGAALVAAAVAVHAMLHGLEAPAVESTALWWFVGALSGSVLVSGGSFLLLQRLPVAWSRGVAVLLALGGGVAALGPAGQLIR
jgi:urease accessory protein